MKKNTYIVLFCLWFEQATNVQYLSSAMLLSLAMAPYCLAVVAVAGLVLIWWSWRPRWAVGTMRFRLCLCFRRSITIPLLTRRGISSCKLAPSSSKIAAAAAAVWRPLKRDSSSDDDAEDKIKQAGVTEADLETLVSYIDGTDGGPPWQIIMERSTASLKYQAWHRHPEFGPSTQYRTRTVIENASPDLVRDFFWDDEFRTKWDEFHIYIGILQEHHQTGTMIVHCIRKLPFFCGHREYTVVRRIWESGTTYYCITKLDNPIPYQAAPRHRNPKRFDFYFCSWRIKAVEARNGGQMTASEVLLFHREEIGIPKELVKICIQRRMWSLVKKMERGLRAYQVERTSGVPLSRYAFMANITTKVPSRFTMPARSESSDAREIFEPAETGQRSKQGTALKWLVVAGALVMCGLNRGVISKGMAFGIDKGFKRDGKREDRHELG